MLVKVFLYHPIYRKVKNLQKDLCDYLGVDIMISIWKILIFLEDVIT